MKAHVGSTDPLILEISNLQRHAPAYLPYQRTPSRFRRLGGPENGSERSFWRRDNLLQRTGFEPRTVQPVA